MKIPLTRNLEAIIDEEDYELVSKYKWCALKVGYAATSVGGRKNKKMIYMHRLIMNAGPKQKVDHINGNKLDNRKENLRICTQNQNSKNRSAPNRKKTSQYKGVYWDKSRNKWVARIKVNYQGIFIGRYETELEAAKMYDFAAIYYFGSFAKTNFPRPEPETKEDLVCYYEDDFIY